MQPIDIQAMIDEKQGRVSPDQNHEKNVEFILKYVNPELPKSQYSAYIKNEIRRHQKAIRNHNPSLVDPAETNLYVLKKIADDNDIHLKYNISKKKISAADIDHMKRVHHVADDEKARKKYKKTRDRYIRLLNDVGVKIASDTKKSLDELKDLLDQNNVELKKQYEHKWKIHEADVVAGVAQFLDSGLVVRNGVPLSKGYCDVRVVGGGLQSDVKVTNLHNKKKFFIECKLDFESSRYFKYGVEIKNGNPVYTHQRYIDSAKKNDEDVQKVDDLFTKCINMSGFMKDVMQNPEVKDSWKQFGDNIDDLCYWLKNGGMFDGTADREWLKNVQKHMMKVNEDDVPDDLPNELTNGLTFQNGTYPDNFKFIAQVFDRYVQYYIDGYNDLIDYMIENAPDALKAVHNFAGDDDAFDADDFKIPHKKMKRGKELLSNELLQYVNRMQAGTAAFKDVADECNAEIDDEHDVPLDTGEDVHRVANNIRRIELKLNALLDYFGYEAGDYAAFSKLDPKKKLMYFFKLFISSSGRKKNGKNPVLAGDSDQMGNMVICTPVVMKNSRLAQMITDFYVKKDGCAYIQIADRAYQFHEKHNPLGLDNLPIFKDCLTEFEVTFYVTDKLDKIKLGVRAIEPDDATFSGTDHLSFVPKDANFICKVLKKPIEVSVQEK